MNQTMNQTEAQSGMPLLGTTIQWGYVVKDIDADMRQWSEVLKVGPFIYISDLGKIECRYRGQPTDVKLKNALAYYGDIQIELIQQVNDAPSPYVDFMAAGREGLQHIGFWVEDYAGTQQRLEAGGFKPVYSILLPGARHPSRYFEGLHMGAMTELSESTPQKTLLYGAMKRMAQTWDGSRPVRVYNTMADFAAENGVPSWS